MMMPLRPDNPEHKPCADPQCFACQHGMDAARAKCDQLMKKYGWYAHVVPDDDRSPTGFNYHTHGFRQTFRCLNVQIVVPLPFEIVHGMARSIVHMLQAYECSCGHTEQAQRFKHGDVTDQLLQGYNAMFAAAMEGGRRVLRIILPDPQGHLLESEQDELFKTQWIGCRKDV